MSAEIIESMHDGVVPIFFLTQSMQTYLQRNVMFLPYYYTNPDEMAQQIIQTTDGPGLLERGVQIAMTHESNHYLSYLYWGTNKYMRLMNTAIALFQQRSL